MPHERSQRGEQYEALPVLIAENHLARKVVARAVWPLDGDEDPESGSNRAEHDDDRRRRRNDDSGWTHAAASR